MFDQSSIDSLQPVKWRFSFGDLHLGHRESLLLRPFLQPPGKERLAAAVITAHGFEA